tara:strand:- start:234 stop:611 length:378 start_codon:yes stop_codon:yes gene_type:complete
MYQDKKAETWMELWYTLEDIEEREHLCFLGVLPYKLIAKRLYTGLEDSEGAEIYEDDIVLLNKYYMGDGGYDDALGVMEWDDHYCGFMFKILPQMGVSDQVFLFEHVAKVIGNIYENPELIKQGA